MARTRIAAMSDRWMLPSRQLFVFESPNDATRSILKQQLDLSPIPLTGPVVTSEAWQRTSPAGKGLHWDLSLIYKGVWPTKRPLAAPPWRELAFHDTATLDPGAVGRSHVDVLALAGYPTQG